MNSWIKTLCSSQMNQWHNSLTSADTWKSIYWSCFLQLPLPPALATGLLSPCLPGACLPACLSLYLVPVCLHVSTWLLKPVPVLWELSRICRCLFFPVTSNPAATTPQCFQNTDDGNMRSHKHKHTNTSKRTQDTQNVMFNRVSIDELWCCRTVTALFHAGNKHPDYFSLFMTEDH